MITPTQDDFSYTAGYFDGDASFGKKDQLVWIEVTSTNPNILLFFKDLYGGAFMAAKPRYKYPHWKPQFNYKICGTQAINLCQKIIPFLVEKQKQAQILVNRASSEEELFQCKHFDNLILKKDKEYILHLRKTKMSQENDFVYFAGLIDAECSMRIINSGKRHGINSSYKIILVCNNTKIPIFIWMLERFGGNIYFVERQSKNPKYRDQFQWYLSSKSLYEILPRIYPHLKYKKAVCQKLIEFHECGFDNGGDRQSDKYKIASVTIQTKRLSIIQEVHFLNRKGKNSI